MRNNKDKMKPCKVCGKEIAKSAKACPYCGANNKKPFFKIGCLGIIMLVLLFVGGCTLSHLNIGGYVDATVVTNSGNTENITSKDLKKMLKKDERSFDNEYTGADIELDDVFKNGSIVTASNTETPHVSIETDGKWIIHLDMSDENKSLINQLYEGDSIHAEGIISHINDSEVRIDHATVDIE